MTAHFNSSLSSNRMTAVVNHPRPLEKWLDYVGQLHSSAIDLSLQRILPIAKKLNLTKFSCPVITVAGTNGKGSTVKALETIYSTAGYSVGAYTSPHLHRFNERIRTNNQEVSDAELVAAFECIEQARGNQNLSFFEFTTLAALWLFHRARLDVLVLEVGLGGRLDAVNIVDADLAIITTIDLDHCDWLGDNRESIGYEKAGIIRPEQWVVCGDTDPPQSIIKISAANNAKLYLIDKDFYTKSYSNYFSWFSASRQYHQLPKGNLMEQNLSVSLMAIELLQEKLPVPEPVISAAIVQAYLPGRLEKVSKPVSCLLDVAHNPQAARILADHVQKYQPCEGKRLAVIGMLSDKLILQTLEPLLGLIDSWYVGGLHVPRGSDGSHIIDALLIHRVFHYQRFIDVTQAIQAAIDIAKENDQIIVFGSFYTVAAAQELLYKS